MTDKFTALYAAHLQEQDDHTLAVQSIEEHSLQTAELAKFMAPAPLKYLVYLAGLWHDSGKYQDEFQTYLRALYNPDPEIASRAKRVIHAGLGAVHASQVCTNPCGCMLSYLIAGHHAGLPDWENTSSNKGLGYTLHSCAESYSAIRKRLPEDWFQAALPDQELASLLMRFSKDKRGSSLSTALRIAFSCLVDADFLDTEAFMARHRASQRKSLHDTQPSLKDLLSAFDLYMQRYASAPATHVNTLRRQIKQDADRGAEKEHAIFSLTVPTGGGKTLASLSFALRYALRQGKKRIIYAVPYTSIIEQTAAVFREIFKDYPLAVLEHHGSVVYDTNAGSEQEEQRGLLRLATENWDVPLIVTTNVQLFESLFAARTSRCRKVHNICDSVVILDEAQQLPRPYHAPIINVMQDLADYFGVTWLLCTATQPALGVEYDPFGRVLKHGLAVPYELVPDPLALSSQLRRVTVHTDLKPRALMEIASRIDDEECVLCIVNTRRKASELFNLISDRHNSLHLSANMCPAHRSRVISEIKRRLKERSQGNTRPLRVISTQLVEAGVDIDFPVVLRELCGLDSIAQAAGRCNRSGLLPHQGRVEVFTLEGNLPLGHLRFCADVARELLVSEPDLDVLSPETVRRYFSLLNTKEDPDHFGITDKLMPNTVPGNPQAFKVLFRSVGDTFRLIDDEGRIPLIVPYQEPGEEISPIFTLLEHLKSDELSVVRITLRKLQRYTIDIVPKVAQELEESGAAQAVNGVLVLSSGYDEHLGLIPMGEFITETVI